MTPRILVENADLAADRELALPDESAHHVVRVLRLGSGADIELFDGRGGAARARLVSTRPATVRITGRLADEPDSLPITLVQGISAGDRMDWTIEKAVELGVTRIVPVQASRSIVRLDARRIASRAAHWQRIIVAACAQCGRSRLPELAPVRSLPEWLAQDGGPAGALRWLLDPAATRSLTNAVRNAVPANPANPANPAAPAAPAATGHWLLCGPESGLSTDEVAAALARGWQAVGLGPRILRTETAGLAAIVTIQALVGDLRPDARSG